MRHGLCCLFPHPNHKGSRQRRRGKGLSARCVIIGRRKDEDHVLLLEERASSIQDYSHPHHHHQLHHKYSKGKTIHNSNPSFSPNPNPNLNNPAHNRSFGREPGEGIPAYQNSRFWDLLVARCRLGLAEDTVMGLTVASPPTSPSRPKEDVEIGLLSDHHNTPTSLAIAAGPATKHPRRRHVLMGALLLVFCMLGLLLGRHAISASHEESRFSDEPQNSSLLNVLVVGDWGREGNYNQSAVAYQMGIVGDLLGPEFIISTGDNFYENGLTGVNDTAFYKSFTQIYTAQSLQKTWHVVLGNHDYRGDVLAQLDRQLTVDDTRWHCERAFSVRQQLGESSEGSTSYVDFFFYDTNPFVEKYWTDTDNVYDWRGVLPKQEYLDKQKEFLASGLESSSATWKIVIGHHPIRSVGEHGDTLELDGQILPILEANYVDLYLNGHDHCLEHIIGNGIQYLTSGGGSKAWRGIDSSANMTGLQFYYDGQGFLSLSISPSQLSFSFYDALGNTLHEGQLSKA